MDAVGHVLLETSLLPHSSGWSLLLGDRGCSLIEDIDIDRYNRLLHIFHTINNMDL